jgi:hypothetical protein
VTPGGEEVFDAEPVASGLDQHEVG